MLNSGRIRGSSKWIFINGIAMYEVDARQEAIEPEAWQSESRLSLSHMHSSWCGSQVTRQAHRGS